MFTDEICDSIVYRSGMYGRALPAKLIEEENVSSYSIYRYHTIDEIRFLKERERIRIRNKSIHMSSEICEYFNISIIELPCIIMLFKHSHKPVIIPTKGAISIQKYITILKDVRKFLEDNETEIDLCNREVKSLFEDLNILKSGPVVSEQNKLEYERKVLTENSTKNSRLYKEYQVLEKKISNFLKSNSLDVNKYLESFRRGRIKGLPLWKEEQENSKSYYIKLKNNNELKISKRKYSQINVYSRISEKLMTIEKERAKSEKYMEFLKTDIETKLLKFKEALPQEKSELQNRINTLKERLDKLDKKMDSMTRRNKTKVAWGYRIEKLKEFIDAFLTVGNKIKKIKDIGDDLSQIN